MLKNNFITTRGFGKTGLQFSRLLEQLKASSTTEEEKQYFEQIQEEWSDFCVGLTIRSFG